MVFRALDFSSSTSASANCPVLSRSRSLLPVLDHAFRRLWDVQQESRRREPTSWNSLFSFPCFSRCQEHVALSPLSSPREVESAKVLYSSTLIVLTLPRRRRGFSFTCTNWEGRLARQCYFLFIFFFFSRKHTRIHTSACDPFIVRVVAWGATLFSRREESAWFSFLLLLFCSRVRSTAPSSRRGGSFETRCAWKAREPILVWRRPSGKRKKKKTSHELPLDLSLRHNKKKKRW